MPVKHLEYSGLKLKLISLQCVKYLLYLHYGFNKSINHTGLRIQE